MTTTVSVTDLPVALPVLRPILAATLAASIAAPLLFGLYGMTVSAALPLALFAAVIGFLHTLLIGVPYAFWMHRIGRFNVMTMGLGGFAIGAVPIGIVTWESAVLMIFGGTGAAGALAFYAAARVLMRGR
jgi:hypothetical protein